MNCVQTRQIGDRLEVELHRPEIGNAYDKEMVSTLTEIFSGLNQSGNLRMVAIRGAGQDFCLGADLRWMQNSSLSSAEQNMADAGAIFSLYRSILHCPVPVLAIAHGRVYGGGVGLLAAADIAICRNDASLALSEAKWGLVPGIITPLVIHKVGLAKFLDWSLTAREISSGEAMESGLVSFVGSDSELPVSLEKYATHFRRNAPGSLALIKKMSQELIQPWDAYKDSLVGALAEKRISAEAQEGFNAFFAKRTPVWPGNPN